MIKEALQYLQEKFNAANEPKLLHEDDNQKVYLLPGGVIHQEPLQLWKKDHAIHHVDDLIVFMNAQDGEGQSGRRVIFVNEEGVAADLEYESTRVGRVVCTFTATDQFLALNELSNGVTQKRLFTHLYSVLQGTVNEDLKAFIRNIKLSKSEEAQSSVDVCATSAEGRQTLQVSFPAKDGIQTAEIPTDWVFTVPIWEEWDRDYKLETRIEIDVASNPLRFIFHIPEIQSVKRQAVKDVVMELEKEITGDVGVYSGQLLRALDGENAY